MVFTKEDINRKRRECEKYGIIWNIGERWEKGIDHHPEVERIFSLCISMLIMVDQNIVMLSCPY